jgi:hypothetical protein
MIEEFDRDQLQRRRTFLETRAKNHTVAEIDRRWHSAAAATLFRDAAAVAFIIGDIEGGRSLLRQSGNLFWELGFVGGIQLLYISGSLDKDSDEARDRINSFDRAFAERSPEVEPQVISSEVKFQEDSFRPPQLLRIYQALAGRLSDDEEWFRLRREIQQVLNVNSTMPVGTTRIPVIAYLQVYDQFARRELNVGAAKAHMLKQVLVSFVQRREEVLTAARLDRFHWKALLRPAELIDFDLLALLLAGTRRGKRSKLIASAFATRDALTSLPQTLAKALRK